MEEKNQKRGGAKDIKMTSLASKILSQELMKDPKKTGTELAKVLEANGVSVKASTVNKHLTSGAMIKHGCPSFTFKRLVCHPEERNSSRTLTARVKYVHEYLYYKNRGTVFIFIDETKFNATDFRAYERSPVEEHATSRRRITTMSVTAITAITSLGEVHHTMFVKGSVNSTVFQTFLAKLIEAIDRNSYTYTIIMDNVSFHKTVDVKELLEKKWGVCSLYCSME